MNDIQPLLAALALVTITGAGCSSSSTDNAKNADPPQALGTLGATPVANDKQFTSPFDATPDPDGKFVYFTAMSVNEGPAVFKVGADGQGLTRLFAGSPLVSPFGISITDDGKTLVIADSGAESEKDEENGTDQGGIVFTLGVDGGTPAPLSGTQGTMPRGLEVLGDSVYYTGTQGQGAKAVPAVYKAPVMGGAPTVLASGPPLRDPSGIAVTKSGDVFVLDAAAATTHRASVFKIAGGAPTEIATDIMVGYPSGIALSADEKTLLVSALDDTAATDLVFELDATTGERRMLDSVQKTIGQFGESAGLHRSRSSAVFAWSDGKANSTGTVYVLK